MNLREWALPLYTILMQLAVGTLLVLWILRFLNLKQVGESTMDRILRRPVMVMFFTILAAIIGSHLHLSNPLLSFLAVLNVKNSWLSREIVFTVLTFLSCAALVDLLGNPQAGRQGLKTALGWTMVFLGFTSIYCMGSIYKLPTQAPWNHWSTILQFYGSSLLLGVTAAAALLVMDTIFSQEHEPDLAEIRQQLMGRSLGLFAGLASFALILIIGLNTLQILDTGRGEELAQTSLSLLTGLYRPLLTVRVATLGVAVGIFILVVVRLSRKGYELPRLVIPVYLACFLALVAEILGRFLFYASHVRLGL